MFNFFLFKLSSYKEKNMNYKIRVLLLLRGLILRFYDPVVSVLIGRKLLKIKLSHQLPIYLVMHNLYDTALPRIINKISANKELYIVDVGANVGDTAALIKSVNKNVKILCIEGNREYLSLLNENYKDDSSVTIEDVFCSDFNETKNISLDTKSGTATIKLNIKSDTQANFLTLDEIINKNSEFSNVDLIKVDTDGFDYKVLRGATEVLKNQQPFVFFELDKSFLLKNNEVIMSVFNLFEKSKYDNFLLYDNYGYLVGLFNFSQLDLVESIIDYMDNKKMYLDVLMIKDVNVAKDLFQYENKSIESILKQ